MIRSGFLARTAPLVRRTPLAKVGRKAKGRARDWELCKRAVADRESGCCQHCHHVVPSSPECWGTLHYHHVVRRSQAPRLVCDPGNVVLIHEGFHRHVHEHVAWAKEMGWLR